MSRYIGKYISTCDMCLQTKFTCQLPSRELHPLPIPDMPWDTASVDFIVELPESNGKDTIMVVVDSVTKCSHCKGTLILAFFTDGISPPHNSGHIPSMQHPVHPTTSSVKQPTP